MAKHNSQARHSFLASLTLFVVIAIALSFSQYVWSGMIDPWKPNGDTIVCITATGEKYHLPSCSYLHSSSFDISLETARAKGYGQCSRCEPPKLVRTDEYIQRKDEQSIILKSLLVLTLSVPLSFVVVLIVSKFNDLLVFLNDFPDEFFIAMFAAVYIAILVQGFRIVIIW